MNKIKVLWMNNGDESLLEYIELGKNYQIDITPCKCMTDCRHHLNDLCAKWDAVILNAKINDLPKEKPSVYKLNQAYIDVSKYVPCFVVIPNEHINKASLLNSIPKGERYYNLKEEHKNLFDAIRIRISNNPINRVLERYSNVCSFCDLTELIDLLLIVEHYSALSLKEQAEIPNKIRTILEWLKEDSPLFMGKKLSPSMKEALNNPKMKDGIRFCEYYSELPLNKFSRAFEASQVGVPIYVHRSFFACVSSCQPGSHYKNSDGTDESVRQDIKNGHAPYLIFALIFELLIILNWCASLDEKTFEL